MSGHANATPGARVRSFTVTLPWPASGLSPNARGHWAIKAKLAKSARRDAHLLTCMTIGRHGIEADAVDVLITFNPPDRRKRDDDNLIASVKSHRDGIAAAIGVDDAHWSVSYRVAEPVKGGRVVVEISHE